MVKKVAAVIMAVLLLCGMIPLSAFADDVLDVCPKCGERTYETWNDCTSSIPDIGLPLSCKRRHCTFCQYTYYDWNCMGFTGYKDFDSGSGNLIADYLKEWKDKTFGKNATAKKYETGGGSAGTGGVGRRPSGYSENNKPDVSNTGLLHFYAPVTGWTRSTYSVSKCAFWTSDRITDIEVPSANASGTVFPSSVSSGSYVMAVCAFTAPVSGTYSTLPGNVIGKYRYVRSNKWYINEYISSSATGSYAKGDSAWLVAWASAACSTYAYDAEGYGVDIYVAPLESTVKPSNSITINQNVWNGNIYQDNSTNLTYIYPQYTTINENNETVTNISNNPIIYNNETKQYYTYDTVTNNYYYITYEAPTPSPSPDPTPTPDPGGDTDDTSGIMKILQEIKAVLVSGFAGITEKLQNIGVGGSTPETAKPGSSSGNKGQSWWEKLLGKIGDAIVDGLLGAISAVLKLIFKLFTTILGWIIWLVSQVLTLFPFLPPGLGALLIGGVVVCFIIGLIKFIRG